MLEIPDEKQEATSEMEQTEIADTEEVVDSVVEKMAEIEAEANEESTDAGEEE